MRTIDLFSVTTRLEKKELLQAIKNSKGRTVVTELFMSKPALLGDVSNLETARAFGSDLLLLNDLDLSNMTIPGINTPIETVNDIKKYVSSPIGIDLYIINPNNTGWPGPELEASNKNLERAIALGFDYVNLVADPDVGVNNDILVHHIKHIPDSIKAQLVIISGRMNFAGLTGHASELFSVEFIQDLANAGVDILLLPTPGTSQGMDMSLAGKLVAAANQCNMMTMSGIGSSQEGSDEDTIRRLAMNARMIGVDMHHLGDAGYACGMATPENITAYSIAIKGKRHTYRKMARR